VGLRDLAGSQLAGRFEYDMRAGGFPREYRLQMKNGSTARQKHILIEERA
jgi:hypothetical protein